MFFACKHGPIAHITPHQQAQSHLCAKDTEVGFGFWSQCNLPPLPGFPVSPACLSGSPSLLPLSMPSGACPMWEMFPRAGSTLGASQGASMATQSCVSITPGCPAPALPWEPARVPGPGQLSSRPLAQSQFTPWCLVLPPLQTQFPFSSCSTRPRILLALAAAALPSPCTAWPCSHTALHLPLLPFISSTEHPLLLSFAIFL